MPLGLWKSKWEIHREDMERYREEAKRRDAVYHERMEQRDAELREERGRADERWTELREETRDLHLKYDHELEETRLFNRELQIRMEKTYANLGTTLQYVGEELGELKEETRDLRVEYDREITATRLFNRELLIRLEKTYANLNATMVLVGDDLGAAPGGQLGGDDLPADEAERVHVDGDQDRALALRRQGERGDRGERLIEVAERVGAEERAAEGGGDHPGMGTGRFAGAVGDLPDALAPVVRRRPIGKEGAAHHLVDHQVDQVALFLDV